METLPLDYITVARLSDLPAGGLQVVQAGDRTYALANVDGTVYALDNNCPHNGGPLGKGVLRDDQVVCPWHGWTWDVRSGRNVVPGTDWRVPRVPVRVVGDAIQLPLI